MTDLEKKLQEIATKDWNEFIALIGNNSILSAQIILLRRKKKSYREIANKLRITYDQARYGCRKCESKT